MSEETGNLSPIKDPEQNLSAPQSPESPGLVPEDEPTTIEGWRELVGRQRQTINNHKRLEDRTIQNRSTGIIQFREETQSLQAQLDRAENETVNANAQRSQAESALINLQNANWEGKYNILAQQLKEEQEARLAEHQSRLQDKDLDQSRTYAQGLEKQIEDLGANIAYQDNQIEESIKELKTSEILLQEEKARSAQLRNENTRLKADVDKFTKELKESNGQIDKLSRENSDISRRLGAGSDRINKAEADAQAFKDLKERAEKDSRGISRDLQTALAAKQDLETQVENLMQEVGNFDDRMIEAEENDKELRQLKARMDYFEQSEAANFDDSPDAYLPVRGTKWQQTLGDEIGMSSTASSTDGGLTDDDDDEEREDNTLTAAVQTSPELERGTYKDDNSVTAAVQTSPRLGTRPDPDKLTTIAVQTSPHLEQGQASIVQVPDFPTLDDVPADRVAETIVETERLVEVMDAPTQTRYIDVPKEPQFVIRQIQTPYQVHDHHPFKCRAQVWLNLFIIFVYQIQQIYKSLQRISRGIHSRITGAKVAAKSAPTPPVTTPPSTLPYDPRLIPGELTRGIGHKMIEEKDDFVKSEMPELSDKSPAPSNNIDNRETIPLEGGPYYDVNKMIPTMFMNQATDFSGHTPPFTPSTAGFPISPGLAAATVTQIYDPNVPQLPQSPHPYLAGTARIISSSPPAPWSWSYIVSTTAAGQPKFLRNFLFAVLDLLFLIAIFLIWSNWNERRIWLVSNGDIGSTASHLRQLLSARRCYLYYASSIRNNLWNRFMWTLLVEWSGVNVNFASPG